ncbi:MAG: HAMP domain-containing histidine kinase [Cyanobacteria bacterium CRU_2_1]|nr:HAMP domain-containing histidine kinase [Cyanobacteria bacterium CRU_2_1]
MFQSLRWRLLLAYLMTMLAILGMSAVAVYSALARSLNQQLNERLETLAQASIPSLVIVKTRGVESLESEVSWRDIFRHNQGLEWFNVNGELLARDGDTYPNTPLPQAFSSRHLSEVLPVIQEQGQIRSLSIAVYTEAPDKNTLRLEGFVRASESTKELETRLNQLQEGLEIGGVIALVLSGISGVSLTWFALQPLQRSFSGLKQFTAEAAHELRGPLTAISTTVELMQTHPDQMSTSDLRKLGMIANATDQIIRLVEDLRFLIQMDVEASQSPQLRYSSVSLNAVLQDLTERFQPQAENKEIQFEPYLLTDLVVKGDSHQLSRLFANLLENAIKYTQSGGRVALFLERHKRYAVIRVEDTGVGIPKEQMSYVFQRFWRSDRVRSHQDGLGLGLAIAQAIVQRHGGEIKVRSEEGIGSSFQVYLPLLNH